MLVVRAMFVRARDVRVDDCSRAQLHNGHGSAKRINQPTLDGLSDTAVLLPALCRRRLEAICSNHAPHAHSCFAHALATVTRIKMVFCGV